MHRKAFWQIPKCFDPPLTTTYLPNDSSAFINKTLPGLINLRTESNQFLSLSSPLTLPSPITLSRSILDCFAEMTAFITAGIPLSSISSTFTTRNVSPRRTLHTPRKCPMMLIDPHLPSHLIAANPAALEKVAAAFNTLGMPKWLVEYGHPAMMGFMVLGMGAPGALIGWKGRLNDNKKEGVSQKKLHENIMIAFFLLAFFGGTGGTLSVAMQGFDIWQSPHFISSAVVLLMLGLNSVIAYSGFTVGNDGTPKGRLAGRKLHAYFGAATMGAFLVHGALGAKILLG